MVSVNTCSSYKVHHHVVLNSLDRFHLPVINRKSCLVYFACGLPEAQRLYDTSLVLGASQKPVDFWPIWSTRKWQSRQCHLDPSPASSQAAPAAHLQCSYLCSWKVWSWGSAETKPQDVTSTNSSSEAPYASCSGDLSYPASPGFPAVAQWMSSLHLC